LQGGDDAAVVVVQLGHLQNLCTEAFNWDTYGRIYHIDKIFTIFLILKPYIQKQFAYEAMSLYLENMDRSLAKVENMPHPSSTTGPAILRDGLDAGWPICLGYLPIGMAFGVLAQKAGLMPVQIGMMSVLVFAGSSQFIAVSMLSAGASAAAIITTPFVVNLRHVLMSSALAVYLKAAHRGLLALYAYGVTDESFAVNLPRFNDSDWSLGRALVVNHAANLTWFVSTVAGGIGGRFIPDGALGIDYALIAMFIYLLIYQIRKRIHLLTAVIAGITAVVLALLIPGNTYIVIASMTAAMAGVIIQRHARARRPDHD
jgi:4-azaleucine resistance transporter AzlC